MLRKSLENESNFFSKSSAQNRLLETSIRRKHSERGSPTFSLKIPERVDVETRK